MEHKKGFASYLIPNQYYRCCDIQEKLTKTETAVLLLLANGMLYKEAAAMRGISLDTVKKHAKNIYRKLAVRNRTEALAKCMDHHGINIIEDKINLSNN